jgi:hypothetical protein
MTTQDRHFDFFHSAAGRLLFAAAAIIVFLFFHLPMSCRFSFGELLWRRNYLLSLACRSPLEATEVVSSPVRHGLFIFTHSPINYSFEAL